MATVYLNRRARFSASHRLHNPNLSDAENIEIFGKCNNPNGHGHNYELNVIVRGVVDENGMVINLNTLKKIIDESIIFHVDHKHLNYDVDFLKGINPTSENLAVCFWQQLQKHLPVGMLHEVIIHETENNIVSYKGE